MRVSALFLCLLLSALLSAQDPFELDGFDFDDDSPVEFSASAVEQAVPGSDVVITVTAKIERGWHIYGFDMDPDLGVPTSMVVVGAGDLETHEEIREPEPHGRDDDMVGGYIVEHSGTVQFQVPLRVPEDAKPGPRKILIDIAYQVCDAKQCLQPTVASVETTVTVGSRKASPASAQNTSLTVTAQAAASPVSWKGTGVADFEAGSTIEIQIEASIERGWHIYGIDLDPLRGDPTTFEVSDQHPFRPGDPIEVTPARSRDDPLAGGFIVEHERKAIFRLPLTVPTPIPDDIDHIRVTVAYMVCDARICLPAEKVTLAIPLRRDSGMQTDVIGDGDSGTPPDDPLRIEVDDGEVRISAGFSQRKVHPGDEIEFRLEGSVDESMRIPSIRKDTRGAAEQAGLLGIILLSIGGALVALLTPCVYPMIPITVSVFTKQAHESRARVLWLAALFGAGIVVSFTALGFLLSALLGEEGANFMATNGYVNLAIGALFVIFGFSLFGYYDIQLPGWLRNRVGGSGGGGGAASVLVMGLVFSVTTFTCVGPIVAFLLALAAGEGPGYAAVGMLAFSTTLAVPFVLLALFPKVLTGLPRSGGWLSTVKVILGFIELLAAWKFFSAVATYWQFGELVNREVIMAIWGLTLAALALNLIGKLRFPHDSPVTSISFGRGVLLALTVTGAFSCFYATTGWRLNENLEAQLLVPSIHAKQHLPWRVLDRDRPLDFPDQLQQLQQQIAAGTRSPRPIFVNFTGHT
ncbi:MAG: cytochrome c biogenesis protein CcdA [Planctomycetota bacterium]